ncbi:hypothetical protein ZIOFF_018912 [Zingiber officinale]|uniref:Uncharacterized protein n=1 Tax=Zingiber officinale TaxID=94328 RepID=A0A8J5HDJ0_ZINOF|nr:hypothetical protein ZIOFF_018912 [Zingiber officinale]
MVTDPTSGMIHFDIGIARKRLAASAFDMPPECRPEVEEATVRIVIHKIANGCLTQVEVKIQGFVLIAKGLFASFKDEAISSFSLITKRR